MTPTEDLEECPTCEGKGKCRIWAQGEYRTGYMKCYNCEGTGRSKKALPPLVPVTRAELRKRLDEAEAVIREVKECSEILYGRETEGEAYVLIVQGYRKLGHISSAYLDKDKKG